MAAPKFTVTKAISLHDNNEDQYHITTSEQMLGLFNALSKKMGYHPANPNSPMNVIGIQNLLEAMSSPLTYEINHKHGFLGKVYDKLMHPSGKTNPFYEIEAQVATYNIVEYNWDRIIMDIAMLIANSIYRPDASQFIFQSIQHVISTASSYENEQDRSLTSTRIVKHILSKNGENPTVAMYWIDLDLANILYFNQSMAASYLNYSYAIFGFDKNKYDIIFDEEKAAPFPIERWISEWSSGIGPFPMKRCQ